MRKNFCDRCKAEGRVNLIEVPKRSWGKSALIELCDVCTDLLNLKVRDFVHEGKTHTGVVRLLDRIFLGSKEENSVSVPITNAGTEDKF